MPSTSTVVNTAEPRSLFEAIEAITRLGYSVEWHALDGGYIEVGCREVPRVRGQTLRYYSQRFNPDGPGMVLNATGLDRYMAHALWRLRLVIENKGL
jgi:hypothetical protein